jgi:hypothetical protein
MLKHSRTPATDPVALGQAPGKVGEVAIAAMAAVGVVAPVVVEPKRNRLVWLARRKERSALEQAMAVQTKDPPSVQTKAQARQGVVQEAE